MPTTTEGLPYPAATENVAEGAAAIQALAEALDARLPGRTLRGSIASDGSIVAGTGFTVTKPAGSTRFDVAFATPFAAPPILTLVPLVPSAHWIENASAAGFSAMFDNVAAFFHFSATSVA